MCSFVCLHELWPNSCYRVWPILHLAPIGYVRLYTSRSDRPTNEGCFSDLNWKTSYCSELSDWPFELSRVLTITVEWVA